MHASQQPGLLCRDQQVTVGAESPASSTHHTCAHLRPPLDKAAAHREVALPERIQQVTGAVPDRSGAVVAEGVVVGQRASIGTGCVVGGLALRMLQLLS